GNRSTQNKLHTGSLGLDSNPGPLQREADLLTTKYLFNLSFSWLGRSMSLGGVTFALERQSKDPQSVVYTGLYDTEGVAHTKSGERQPLQISIQFSEAGTFETVWQVKYYNYNKRDHCQWGNSFNTIEYECKPNDTRTLMWVNKETFI
uniref:Cannabinoid receptor interacting protein 1b n=1 Tax=Hippocampus comes TaxID=109280 RepID=A0A3Q2Y6C1_HIPCM